WWIKRFGGIALVQDPKEASFPDMPRNAMVHAAIDYVEKAARMGRLLSRLIDGPEAARSIVREA
ncbi:MAG TPA: chemotaxis protein CheB, partial [Bryobacteraceae bacterium]